MVSQIDPTVPADGVPADKADLRQNFAFANQEITALQAIPNGTIEVLKDDAIVVATAIAMNFEGAITVVDEGGGKATITVIPGAAPIATVFGRTGAIAAVLGDYAGSLISNDSAVAGANVSLALNQLNNTKAAVVHNHTLSQITDILQPTIDQRIAFQEGFTQVDIATPGRALVDTPNGGDYRRHLDLDNSAGDVSITLPDLDSFGVPTIAGVDTSTVIPFAVLRPLSSNFVCSITTAVAGRLRTYNGYGSHVTTSDQVFLGLGNTVQLGLNFRLGFVGNFWVVEGYLRDTSTKDLSFDGPGVSRSDATNPIVLTNSRAPGGPGVGGLSEVVYATNAGTGVTLNVTSFTILGAAKEVHNLTGGDITVVGMNAASDTLITQNQVAFVRVRPDGVYVKAQ